MFYRKKYHIHNTVVQNAESKCIQTASASNEHYIEYASKDDPLKCVSLVLGRCFQCLSLDLVKYFRYKIINGKQGLHNYDSNFIVCIN